MIALPLNVLSITHSLHVCMCVQFSDFADFQFERDNIDNDRHTMRHSNNNRRIKRHGSVVVNGQSDSGRSVHSAVTAATNHDGYHDDDVTPSQFEKRERNHSSFTSNSPYLSADGSEDVIPEVRVLNMLLQHFVSAAHELYVYTCILSYITLIALATIALKILTLLLEHLKFL